MKKDNVPEYPYLSGLFLKPINLNFIQSHEILRNSL